MSTHLPLWRRAREFLVRLFDLFGAPIDVAAHVLLPPQAHARIASWIGTIDAIMRRLILIEALALPRPNLAPTPPTQAAPRQRTPRALYDPTDPQTWRVSFVVFHGGRTDSGETQPREYKRRYPTVTRPLALRFEALMRAFNDPAPYAKRLARKLHRNAARAYKLLRNLRAPRTHFADDLIADLNDALAPGAAQLVLNTS